ncbi:MAG: LysM peptidoglycan-binding domain-containing protein [Dysgonamonadaceae bacterium]|nr:LysM peptidoglycan-binding domain-containing protein [Dysgonamonadaceae bacterium]MDD3355325.1 LysM peptidoglycan-binding domain-containing protein [Dysgonamonadaceae bacterium]MDD3726735.1 LysM peptidoglycan-binding domain-containing protein [Dysgonamonadaceae bacterium]MDD4245580.1 LysM peptidoglycan-binding domain-containing protein [Dysgonamonadaceae bacterium]MDD4605279.1 LysM peptidoglycan-binding domain-containing protein [Dysgonamonadaceae bacterium]
MNRFYIFTLFTMITLLAVAQSFPYPKITINEQEFYQYEVKPGEGLFSISRTFSIPIDQILKHNPSAKDGLTNGQKLNIPIPQHKEKPVLDQNSVFYHKIERGETVYSLAAMYNTTEAEIYRLNPSARSGITEGAILIIPQRKIISEVKEENYRYHTISPKETLYSVSKTYSLTPEDIIAANPGLSIQTFQIGKTIRIPFFESNETFSSYEGPVVVEQTKHKVKSGETLYSISQQYGVSVDEIKQENPGVSSTNLSTNKVLIIPVKRFDRELARQDAVNESRANVLLSGRKPSERLNVIQVALLMPFLEKKDGQNTRIQEYYEGFLLAVEKLKKQGVDLELYVFDIGTESNTKKLESLLTTLEMQSLDLIVGGVSDNQIKILSDFSKSKNIKYVIPFSSKDTEVLNNGNIFQVNTPQATLYTRASNVFVRKFNHANIIFLNAKSDNEKDNLISIMQNDLKNKSIPYKSLAVSETMNESLLPLLDETKENILIPSSGEIAVLGQILGSLNQLKEASPEVNVHLFGYPEWQTYESNYLKDYHNHGTYFYSSFYVDKNSSDIEDFEANFKEWYQKNLQNTYPQYAILGYDTALYFLTALHRYGRNFETQLNSVNVKTLQFAFNFERVNNWGGFINTGLFLVHYDTDSRIIKSDQS